MKSSLSYLCLLTGCFVSVTCYQIPDEPPNLKKLQQPNVTSEEQQRIEAQRELMAQREAARQEIVKKQQQLTQNTTIETPKETLPKEYPFASPVDGKEGFVLSPYNNEMVDVRNIPSGTLVGDPGFPESEMKYFRVP